MKPSVRNDSHKIQSVDIYVCKQSILILLVCSDGGVYLTSFADALKNLEPNKIISGHSSEAATHKKNEEFSRSRRVHIATSNKRAVIVSCGEDKVLRFWNVADNHLIKEVYLDFEPTVAKFSPNTVSSDSEVLVLGAKDGILAIYNVEYKKTNDKDSSLDLDPGRGQILHEGQGLGGDRDTAVLNIEFSKEGNMMAVSYESLKKGPEKEDRGRAEAESFIIIYNLKDYYHSSKVSTLPTNLKQAIIQQPGQIAEEKGLGKNVGVHFMQFTIDDIYLMVCYQNIDQNQIRINANDSPPYIIIDLRTNNPHHNLDSLKNAKFLQNNFPNSIVGCKKTVDISRAVNYRNLHVIDSLPEALRPNNIICSAMRRSDKITFLGCTEGDIYICKNSFYSPCEDKITTDEITSYFCIAKMYAAHISFVDQLECSRFQEKEFLYSTGLNDEAVYKWRVIHTDAQNELDHVAPLADTYPPDQFLMEVPPRDYIISNLNSYFRDREQLINCKSAEDKNIFTKVRLNLARTIGRSAYHLRNSLVVTRDLQLFYPCGTLLVGLNLKPNLNGSESVWINPQKHDDAGSELLQSAQQRVQIVSRFNEESQRLDVLKSSIAEELGFSKTDMRFPLRPELVLSAKQSKLNFLKKEKDDHFQEDSALLLQKKFTLGAEQTLIAPGQDRAGPESCRITAIAIDV